MIRCSLPLLTETRVVPTGSGRLPLISPRPKLGMSRGQPHTTGSATSFSGRTLKRRNVLWRALFANLRFLAKLRFLCYKKKKEKNIRVPRRDLSTRDSSTAPLLISFLIVKRIRLLPRQRNRSRITFESFFFRTRFLPLVEQQFQSQVPFK